MNWTGRILPTVQAKSTNFKNPIGQYLLSPPSHNFCTKVCKSLVWYSIDREDQENESGFLCKKHFFVEKTVGSRNGLPRYQLTFSS